MMPDGRFLIWHRKPAVAAFEQDVFTHRKGITKCHMFSGANACKHAHLLTYNCNTVACCGHSKLSPIRLTNMTFTGAVIKKEATQNMSTECVVPRPPDVCIKGSCALSYQHDKCHSHLQSTKLC